MTYLTHTNNTSWAAAHKLTSPPLLEMGHLIHTESAGNMLKKVQRVHSGRKPELDDQEMEMALIIENNTSQSFGDYFIF